MKAPRTTARDSLTLTLETQPKIMWFIPLSPWNMTHFQPQHVCNFICTFIFHILNTRWLFHPRSSLLPGQCVGCRRISWSSRTRQGVHGQRGWPIRCPTSGISGGLSGSQGLSHPQQLEVCDSPQHKAESSRRLSLINTLITQESHGKHAEPKLRPHPICTFCTIKIILLGTAQPQIPAS